MRSRERAIRQQLVRERACSLGLLAEPPPPERVPGRDEVLRSTAGAGDAASRALDEDRGPR